MICILRSEGSKQAFLLDPQKLGAFSHDFVTTGIHVDKPTKMPLSCGWDPDQLRDAIVAAHKGDVDPKHASAKFNVPTRKLKSTLADLESIGKIGLDGGQEKSLENDDCKQVCQWATK